MEKILISWYAYNNDFGMEQKGAIKRRIGTINENGPTFNVHKYCWDQGKYSRHILLNSNLKDDDKKYFELLKTELRKNFNGHLIESRDIIIEDIINVSEIFSKLNSLLAEFTDSAIEIFISPGTPAMQTAWYLLGTNYKKNVTLFQLREIKHTKEKIKPEKIIVSLDSNVLPTNMTVAQKVIDKVKTSSDILITDSLKPFYKKAEQIALTDDVGCLILGENGTGKENLAKHIHENSNRVKKPFIPVNCAAFSDELLRSELFGHEKGAFTGAENKKTGMFEAASGGTLFLDEIGDISPKMQVSLLRALQERKIQPVGATKEIPIDVRVVAATNKDLEELCEQDKFRWDLFFRLAVTTLKLPALRERGKKEIKELVVFFNKLYAKRFPSKKELKITEEALSKILSYGYKGNIRELENMFIHFYTFCVNEITIEDLPERVKENKSPTVSLADCERQHIIKVFNQNKQIILVTAKALDISKDTLKRKLTDYGIREGKG